MSISRRNFLVGSTAMAATTVLPRVVRAQRRRLRFGVGPFMPTAQDTRKAFTPLFAHLAQQLGGGGYDLAVSTDWAGLAIAMGSGQLDGAWMGPWGYVIANRATRCQAVATVKYDDKPTYHAIIVARPGLAATQFPQDTRGRSISFADQGSTSGWLIPSYYAREVWKIDPKTYWKYSEGASHPANEVAVASGQVDLATDYDRNRDAMIAAGRLRPDATKIVWTSDALPNDAFALPATASREFAAQVQSILTSIDGGRAASILPPRYTGFLASTHSTYRTIESAGIALGHIREKGREAAAG
jgi:phosphonate transport system substrate-binding protein